MKKTSNLDSNCVDSPFLRKQSKRFPADTSANPIYHRRSILHSYANPIQPANSQLTTKPIRSFVRGSQIGFHRAFRASESNVNDSIANLELALKENRIETNQQMSLLSKQVSMDRFIERWLPIIQRKPKIPSISSPPNQFLPSLLPNSSAKRLSLNTACLPFSLKAGKPFTIRFDLDSPISSKYLLGNLIRCQLYVSHLRTQNPSHLPK